MNKAALLGTAILLSTSIDGFANQRPQAIARSDVKPGEMPEYPLTEEEIKTAEAYKKLLSLKLHHESAYDTHGEAKLLAEEEKILETLEKGHSKESEIENQIKEIDSKLPGMLGKALQLWWGSSPEQQALESEKASLGTLINDLKSSIQTQENSLENVSANINEMEREKEQLETALPTLLKSVNAAAPTQSFMKKKKEIKAEDPMHARIKEANLGNISDPLAIAFLAQRFLIKLGSLDSLYETLGEKLKDFKSKIDEDNYVLTLMEQDPELKKEGFGWGSWVYARLWVVGDTQSGLTSQENEKLAKGLGKIKPHLRDEITKYKEVIKIFDDYVHTLPTQINTFKKKKTDFFKKHYDAAVKAISAANKEVVNQLVDALEKKAKLENPTATAATATPITASQQKNNKNQKVASSLPQVTPTPPSPQQIEKINELDKKIKDLRNQSAFYLRRVNFLDQAIEVEPSSGNDLVKIQETIDQSMSSGEKEGTIDDMLEALVNLTQVVEQNATTAIQPLIKENVGGFLGDSFVRKAVKASAPAAVSALTGLLQSKLVEAVGEGATYSKDSPPIRLLQYLSDLKEVEQKLSLKDQDKSLDQKRKELLSNIKRLQKDMKPNISHSTAENKTQKQQEAQSMIVEAIVGVLEASSQDRINFYITTVDSFIGEFQYDLLNRGKEKVLQYAVPYISGLVEAFLSQKVGELSQDPTKLAYHDKRIVDLLTRRITAKPGSAEYQKLSDEIQKDYESVMETRKIYMEKLIKLGDFREIRKGWLGYGSETEVSKLKHRRTLIEAMKGAMTLGRKVKENKK